MRGLWLVLVAAAALASARKCTPGSLAELSSTLKPVVEACEDAECSPECRELIAAPTTVTKQAKRCIGEPCRSYSVCPCAAGPFASASPPRD